MCYFASMWRGALADDDGKELSIVARGSGTVSRNTSGGMRSAIECGVMWGFYGIAAFYKIEMILAWNNLRSKKS